MRMDIVTLTILFCLTKCHGVIRLKKEMDAYTCRQSSFIRSMQLGKIQMSTESPFKKFYKRKYTAGRKKPGDKRSIPKIDENIRKKIQEKMLKIPPGLELVIEKYIENKTGKQLESPGTLERIRQAVLVQKAGYWNKNPHAKYERGYDVFAYLAYQAPGYIIQFHHIIQKLEKTGLLPDNIRVLDLGSGPGVVPLALTWFFKERKKGALKIDAIERSEEFIEAFKSLVPEFAKGSPVNIEHIHHADIMTGYSINQDLYNLITCQNVLAELSDYDNREKTEILMKYCSSLTEDGFLILVEPAELRHSTSLRVLQRELERSGLYLVGPCRYIHEGECVPAGCWSFAELPGLKPTRLMLLLAGEDEGYRFLNTDIKFSYSIFSKKPEVMTTSRINRTGTTPFRDLKDNIGEFVNVIGTKMSPDIGTREFSVFLFCDGSGGLKVYLVAPNSLKHDEIKKLKMSEYGEVLKISGVRVRWNKKKNSINLIAGSRTHVSAIHK
jgi:SAM-dependent methyltransferase